MSRKSARELSKPQGGVAVDRGGIELRADDKFLKKSYLPIEVTVEALDNDPVKGPKWGRSDPIVLLPPQIGEREAMRYRALKEARDSLTDLLAERLKQGAPKPAERTAYYTAQKSKQGKVVGELGEVTRRDFGGLTLRGRLAALLLGQIEQLERSLAAAQANGAHAELIDRHESALLAVDSGLGALGNRDTRASAIKLSDVAMDAARAIELSRERKERLRAERRLKADLDVLDAGGRHLLDLGSLGLDLGEIVENGLRRIHRAWDAGDRYHARLAAEDLAARLRQPDPSFGSSGGGGGHGHGGTEGGALPQPGQGEASNAAEDAAGIDQALEQLRQEHAAEMSGVERALRDAMGDMDDDELEKALREQAQAIREAVRGLPRQAEDASSAQGAAARGRSQAESMAGSLERQRLRQAPRARIAGARFAGTGRKTRRRLTRPTVSSARQASAPAPPSPSSRRSSTRPSK